MYLSNHFEFWHPEASDKKVVVGIDMGNGDQSVYGIEYEDHIHIVTKEEWDRWVRMQRIGGKLITGIPDCEREWVFQQHQPRSKPCKL